MWWIIVVLLLAGLIYFSINVLREIEDANTLRKESVGALEAAFMMRYDVIEKLIQYANCTGKLQDENRFIIKLLEAKLIPTLERVEVEKELVGELKNLLYFIEEVPELRGRKELTDYRLALAKAEKNIYDAKTFLNDKTREYNHLLETFPKSIIAKIKKYNPYPYYETEFVTR